MKPIYKRFALYRIGGLGKGAAALKAGSAKSSAPANGTRWSKHPDVIAFITKHEFAADEAKAKAVGVDAAYVMRELVDNSEVAKELGGKHLAISNQALNMIGKELGMFIERSEVVISKEVSDFLAQVVVIIEEEITNPDVIDKIVSRMAAIGSDE